jgi:hypothetical protein
MYISKLTYGLDYIRQRSICRFQENSRWFWRTTNKCIAKVPLLGRKYVLLSRKELTTSTHLKHSHWTNFETNQFYSHLHYTYAYLIHGGESLSLKYERSSVEEKLPPNVSLHTFHDISLLVPKPKYLNRGSPNVLWQRATPVTVGWFGRIRSVGLGLETHYFSAAHRATALLKIRFNTVLPSTCIFFKPLRLFVFSIYISVHFSPSLALRFSYLILFSRCNAVHFILTLRIITKIPILIDNKTMTHACVLDVL